jgi:hypothetical protein
MLGAAQSQNGFFIIASASALGRDPKAIIESVAELKSNRGSFKVLLRKKGETKAAAKVIISHNASRFGFI